MKIYEFAETGVVLNASDGSLRGSDGAPVELRPQSREVLKILSARPGETITKAAFTEAVWEGRQVSEDSLVQCITEIRAALGDGERAVIQTVPRQGWAPMISRLCRVGAEKRFYFTASRFRLIRRPPSFSMCGRWACE